MGHEGIRIHTELIHLGKIQENFMDLKQNPEFSQIWGSLRWIHLQDRIYRSINFLTDLVGDVAGSFPQDPSSVASSKIPGFPHVHHFSNTPGITSVRKLQVISGVSVEIPTGGTETGGQA